METHEIIICGGGLAGSAAAIRLKQLGFSPLLLEKDYFPRKKLCGEFLGPDSAKPLQKLGMWERVSQAAYGPISQATFTLMNQTTFQIPLRWVNPKHPFGLGISREQLDWLLLEEAKAQGVTVLEGQRVLPYLEFDGTSFLLKVIEKGAEVPRILRTPTLLDATGRNGLLTLLPSDLPLRTEGKQKQKIGLKVAVRHPKHPQDKTLRMFFFPGGYGGLQPLSAETGNLCFVAPAEAAPWFKAPFPELIAKTIGQNRSAQEALAGCEPIEPFQTVSNLDFNLPVQHLSGIIRLGDAMVTVDPFTGSGMSIALQTGILAAEVLHDGFKAGMNYTALQQQYVAAYRQKWGRRFQLLKGFRRYLFSQPLQETATPLLSPFLPALARLFR